MKKMNKNKKKWVAGLLAVTICVTTAGAGVAAEAAARPKLSVKKNISLTKGKSKKIQVKNAKNAKITWKSSNKKVAAVKKSGKLAAKVTAKRKGDAVISCKVKKGKKTTSLTCKVKVTVPAKKETQTPAPSPSAPAVTNPPTNAPTNVPTNQPTTEPTNQPTNTPTNAPTQKPTPTPVPVITDSIVKSYEGIFDYMGTCVNYDGWQQWGKQLQDENTVKFIKEQFNSFTLENEMKPDAVLGGNVATITKAEAEALGYVIPENYKEEKVPKLNLDKLDRILEVANENGLKMRAHVLMWHQQTPAWFFTTDYAGAVPTTPEIMDARLEFYVRTVMTHILNKEKELAGEAGDLVYAWDVTNEYLHRSNAPTDYSWVSVYGDLGLKPTYVKKAYQEAYGILKKFGVQDKVVLFYNDYDTYFCSDDLVSLVNYINEGEEAKICGGIGMQSHVDIKRPLLEEYGAALDKFLATGLEVQITELDVTINFDTEGSNPSYGYKNEKETDADQAEYVEDLMELIVGRQLNRDKTVNPKGITGITIWGLYDTVSWRSQCSPLLFKRSLKDPKASFYKFVEVGKANKPK